ncbi:MAG: twin-arginine translocation signal domain-containing protein [Candidatus Glassbacteria bacterium]|nr:twin-arginine translocation signal domain-containing protein [Candidatus Glassbacteria bacterium]
MSDESNSGKLSRRDFLKTAAAGAAMIGTAGASGCSKGEAVVPKRLLGKTAMNVSILAMGGGSALSMVEKDEDALALIDLARRKGINYFDTGSEYGGGSSEMRIGEALEPYRKDLYISTKFSPGLSPDKLMKNFERSLKRLRTDYVDNANMHGLSEPGDVELMFSSGALETLVKLKEEGVVKNIGATAHRPVPLAEGMKRFQFNSVSAATNATRYHFVAEFDKVEGSFEDEVMPLANQQGIGLWAFKVTGQRLLIQRDNEPHKAPGLELIRYGFSLPVHGVILGMTTPEHVITACDLAANFTPMSAEEMRKWNEELAPSVGELTYLDPSYVDDGGWRAHLV